MNKADYVRRQNQTRYHVCHWPGCQRQVPPAMWGCRPHWFALPKRIRDRIWQAYRPGQETDLKVSKPYLAAAREAEEWISKSEPGARVLCRQERSHVDSTPPFEEEKKRLAGRELKRIFEVADRIYRRDPKRFQKLVVWIKTVQRRRYELQYIREALEIVDQKEARGEKIEAWWPYLMAALLKNRTKKLEGESAQYKKGMPNSMRALLHRILEEGLSKKEDK